jgi:hypothetical protein
MDRRTLGSSGLEGRPGDEAYSLLAVEGSDEFETSAPS